MRVAIVTESFLPTVNGVSNSVARVIEELEAAGHEVLVIAPGDGPERFSTTSVIRTGSIPLPGYESIPIGVPRRRTFVQLEEFQPDVVHVGGPVALGAWGLNAARRLDVPSVAIYQTDFPRYTRHYGVGAAEALAWRWLRRIHSQAALTLAPSSAAAWDLRRHGIPDVRIWARGVDLARFTPAHRDPALRSALAPRGEMLVGYVGRLAPEKEVELLRACRGLPNVRLVIVGDGPDRDRLQRRLPEAEFLGFTSGRALSRLFASLDVFVHTGPHETFCQTIQEALASGVPVIAPAVGGPLDLVVHGTNGLLYRPGDRRGLRDAVGLLARRGTWRRQLASNARPSVEGRSWRTLTAQLVDHYLDAVGRTPTADASTAHAAPRPGAPVATGVTKAEG